MSDIKDGRGRPRKGYEVRSRKITVRLEPYEYENLQSALRLTGDSLTDALRQGVSLYVKHVKDTVGKRSEVWNNS